MWVFDSPRNRVTIPNPTSDYNAAGQIKQFTYVNGRFPTTAAAITRARLETIKANKI
jgi:hypothetical protein